MPGRTWLSVLIFVDFLSAASAWPKKGTSDTRSLLPEDPEVYFPSNVEEIPVRYLPRKALKLEVNSEGQIQGLRTGSLAQNQEEADSSAGVLPEGAKPRRSLPVDQEAREVSKDPLQDQGLIPRARALGHEEEKLDTKERGTISEEGPETATDERFFSLEDQKAVADQAQLEVDGTWPKSEARKFLKEEEYETELSETHGELEGEREKRKANQRQEKELQGGQALGQILRQMETSSQGDVSVNESAIQESECQVTKVFKLPELEKSDRVLVVAWSPDSTHVAALIGTGKEQPWGLRYSRWPRAFVVRSDGSTAPTLLGDASSVRWSRTGQLILSKTAFGECSVSYWSNDSGQWQEVKAPVAISFGQGCCDISWSLDETWWAVSLEGMVAVHQVLHGELKQQASLAVRDQMRVRMSPDGRRIFAWKHGHQYRPGEGFLWIRSGSVWRKGFTCTFIPREWYSVGCVPEWSTDSKLLVVPEAGDLFEIATNGSWKLVQQVPLGPSAWSPSHHLAITQRHTAYEVWSPVPDKARFVRSLAYRVPKIGITLSLAWSPNGQHLASGGTGKRLIISYAAGSDVFALKDTKVSARTRSVLRLIRRGSGLSWSPDGTYLAAAWEPLVAT